MNLYFYINYYELAAKNIYFPLTVALIDSIIGIASFLRQISTAAL